MLLFQTDDGIGNTAFTFLRDSGRLWESGRTFVEGIPTTPPKERGHSSHFWLDGMGTMLILTRRPAILRLSLTRISDGLPTL